MKKVSKRETPEDDYYRLAQRVFNKYGGRISDDESFQYYAAKYLDRSPGSKHIDTGKLAEIAETQYFTQEVEELPPEEKKGKPEKKGFSVKKKKKGKPKNFDILGTAKGVTRYGRKDYVIVKGKKQARYRDYL